MEKERSKAAPIFAIQRHRIGIDGKGVTTLVAFMGCPLDCAYCLNDFCHKDVYQKDGTALTPGVMTLQPEELYNKVKIDNIYFQITGGGVCFGGGEPTLYPDFITDFRKLCGDKWKITIETALTCPNKTLIKLSAIVDDWIVDIKDLNPDIYRQYTGKDQPTTLFSNLKYLATPGIQDKVTVKVPLIPEYNETSDTLHNIEQLRKLGFHNIKTIEYLKQPNNYRRTKYER